MSNEKHSHMDTPARGGSSSSHGGGGGAEMVYILLNTLYKRLPRKVDSSWENSTGLALQSIFSAVVPTLIDNCLVDSPGRLEKQAVQKLGRRILENSKSYAAVSLAALVNFVDSDISNMYMDKCDSYLLEAVYILNNGWLQNEKTSPDSITETNEVKVESGSQVWLDSCVFAHPLSCVGTALLEQLGDVFLKTNKYKLAILAYESCLMIHIKLSTELDKKIYRKLSLVAQEAGNITKLFVHVLILKLIFCVRRRRDKEIIVLQLHHSKSESG